MDKRVIYPHGTGIAILIPSGELSLEETIKKDVPVGLPYLVVDVSDIPTDREFRNAWTADFSNPTGISGEDDDNN